MICDLCREDSSRVIRVNSWQVCQWCASNDVLEHALVVESHIAKLREAVANAYVIHQHDLKVETMAAITSGFASADYAEEPTDVRELAANTARSVESLRLAISAKKALNEYAEDEQRKTRRARKGKLGRFPWPIRS